MPSYLNLFSQSYNPPVVPNNPFGGSGPSCDPCRNFSPMTPENNNCTGTVPPPFTPINPIMQPRYMPIMQGPNPITPRNVLGQPMPVYNDPRWNPIQGIRQPVTYNPTVIPPPSNRLNLIPPQSQIPPVGSDICDCSRGPSPFPLLNPKASYVPWYNQGQANLPFQNLLGTGMPPNAAIIATRKLPPTAYLAESVPFSALRRPFLTPSEAMLNPYGAAII